MAPEMCNALPDSYKALHKQLLALVQNDMRRFAFLNAHEPSQKASVPKIVKKLESAQVKLFKYNMAPETDNIKLRTKSLEYVSDLNWNIEHCTLEKLYRQLHL
ncbi:hypothetical protein SK128_021883 [Halocaridina rubra]|uniref:Uncharacterized protein n=1 Tax=Halocaridina rubra TaxID=373956 RepID=A0AAN8XD91_HALRR